MKKITLDLGISCPNLNNLDKGDKLPTFNLLQFIKDISKIRESDQILYIKEENVTELLQQFSDYKARIKQKELNLHRSNLVKTKQTFQTIARKISESSIRTEKDVITPCLKLNIERLSVGALAKLHEGLNRGHKAIENGNGFSHNEGYLVLKDNRQACHRVCLKHDGDEYFYIAFSDYILSRQHFEKSDYYIKLSEKDPSSQKAGTIFFDTKATEGKFRR